MTRTWFVVGAMLATALPSPVREIGPQDLSAQSGQQAAVLVSTEWVTANLDSPDLVLLHVGNQASYDGGHIPGARLMPLATFAPEREGLTTEMPDAAALREALEAVGIGTRSRIVVYSATTSQAQLAARLYITLERFGLGGQASILDGGLTAWRAESRAVTADAPAVARGSVTLSERGSVLVDYTFVRDNLGSGRTVVMDARDTPFWTGEQRNQQRAARAGRIPGAKNVPFHTLLDAQGRLLAPEALAALFTRAGVPDGQPIVTYCHVGQQASLLFLAARVLGRDVRLYDGSYEEWSRRPELPIEP
jgi:thiosulfate/3-mercaptopyruvate sulfurtransferase